ncbi:glucan endo-1 3-beta-glucosidase 13 [Tripterygium wilfordii]|uniref:glucan endo-1,3-beta-D-glucosidase n=1 Tax=Tripterygium wilfordii TaxID=458696 RepID=A0A7J7D565_TRIWF|nr:glucan endo-1,3-beta-glucosidase 3-like [Tripterygium wilfordii]KAF5741409.1 glucan endo-1 3-beta-glucosidase 13 [Tripterygium wilfordii]
MERAFVSCILLLLSVFSIADAGSIGVNYGRIANNLPSAVKVVKLLKSQGLDRVKVFDTDSSVLKALSGSKIKVTVDLPNELLSSVAGKQSFAYSWVQKNVAAYHPQTQIEAIAVGNEVFVDPQNTTKFLLPAMKNIQKALVKYNLDSSIKVSSPIALSALQNSYPSSAGSFRPELVETVFKPMLDFLRQTGSYLMVNAYPFFAFESNSDVISLDYALFRENPGVVDSGNGLRYFNLFDAQIDAVFAALSALKYDDVKVVVTETGWPSKGDENEIGASVENAAAYNGNLIRKILTGGGTPLRPKADLTVYLFALFNENEKTGPTSERNYGLFFPDQKRVYDIPFTLEGLSHYKDKRPPVSSGPQVSTPIGSGGVSKSSTANTWCVANTEVGRERLQHALDYACGEGKADCHPIQPGSSCYEPNSIEAHATYAFNSFYQKNKRAMGTCDFSGAAFVVSQPPRFGQCEFPTGY